MKRWLNGTLAASIAAVGITGCTPKEPSAANAPKGPVKFSISLSDANNKYAQNADLNSDKWVKKLEELAGVDLDLRMIPHQEFKQKTTLMFASNELPDVVNVLQAMTPQSPDMGGSVQAGLFMPLDDLLKEHGQNLLKAIPKAAWDEVTYNGKIYAIPEYLSIPSRRGTFVRKDMLDKTGLPVPKTVDDFLAMLRAMKKNGVEQPFAFRENFVYADVIFGAYDVMPYSGMFEKSGDQIVPKFFNSEAMMKALNVYKTMYDEGLMAKDFASVTGPIWNKTISSGKTAVWNHNANQIANWNSTVKTENPSGEVVIIPSPVGPDGKGGMMIYSSTVRLSYLNSKLDKAKAADIVAFFDFLVTPKADEFFNFGIEGENYKKQDGRIVYTQPVTPEEKLEEGFRSGILRLVKDDAINRSLLSLTEEGRAMIQSFDTIVSKEGREGISFDPPLSANTKYPDVALRFADIPPLLLSHMLKMIYGKEPISDWPKVIEEWKAKGGDEILKEANDRFNKKSGVKIGPDAKGK